MRHILPCTTLSGLGDEPAAVRRLTLLVYRDLEDAHRYLIDVFGFAPGELARDEPRPRVHAEVFAGDGVIWIHRESEEFRLASPATSGTASHCMAVEVDDVDSHFMRTRDAGAKIVYEPPRCPTASGSTPPATWRAGCGRSWRGSRTLRRKADG